MNRRKVLLILGVLVAGLQGRFVKAGSAASTEKSNFFSTEEIDSHPLDIFFDSSRLGNVIIEKKDGSRVVVSWDEIIKALEGV